HSRACGEKLVRISFGGLGGRFQRAFCRQQSCRLEAKLAVCGFSGQCTPNLASEQHLAELGCSLAQWKIRCNSCTHHRKQRLDGGKLLSCTLQRFQKAR